MRLTAKAATTILFAGANAASIVIVGVGIGFSSPFFALMAAICLLGILGLLEPWLPLRVPRFLRDIRPWERPLYAALGVNAFGRWLRRSSARRLNRNVYLSAERSASLVGTHLEYAEAAHTLDLALTAPYFVIVIVDRSWVGLLVLTAFNLFGNLYPILHLRLARHRLQQFEHRQSHLVSRLPCCNRGR